MLFSSDQLNENVSRLLFCFCFVLFYRMDTHICTGVLTCVITRAYQFLLTFLHLGGRGLMKLLSAFIK